MEKISSRTVRLLPVATLAVIALLLTSVSPAWADHEGEANSGTPDNAVHAMDRNNLESLGNTAAVHGQKELDSTQMQASFSGSGDVEIYDGSYGSTGWAGNTTCIDDGWWGECDVYKVKLNKSEMGTSTSKWRSLGCHELGHTAGLGHRSNSNDSYDNSCMRSDIWPENFDSHDVWAINDTV